MTSVTLRNVCKAYGDNLISKNVDLDIAEGEFVVFVGPSGCGKSSCYAVSRVWKTSHQATCSSATNA